MREITFDNLKTEDLHQGAIFVVTLVEVCAVVLTFRFLPEFLFRPAVSSLCSGGPPEGELPEGQERPPWGVSPGEGIGRRTQQLPHSGNASNTFSPPFQGKVMRQEKSLGSLCSSRLPYLWSPTRGKPLLENCTRIW